MKRSSARPEDELPTLAHIAMAYLMMAAAWSVLFIAWPYLVDQVSPPQRLFVERSWYSVPSTRKPQACSASGPHTASLREPFCTRFAQPDAAG